jgi:hypothetical protein
MPSSGARSGTKPGRGSRGAGSGAVGPTLLSCGHSTQAEPLARRANGTSLYSCPEGCGLVKRKSR